MQVLCESRDWLAIDKPAGVPTIADRFGSDNVHQQLQALRGERLWVVHRLDREVGGLLLFARNAATHAALSQAFEHRQVRKTYAAWTEGDAPAWPGQPQHWQDPLLRGKKRAYTHPAGKPAITEAVCEGRSPQGLLIWRLLPLTGRNHQLRVQLANRGWPIAGDRLYGATTPWHSDGIALRAVRIELPSGAWGAPIDLDAPPLSPQAAP